MSLRFHAFEVTLSGFAGGEYLPLPASKGLAFPSLLTLDGYPTSAANYTQGQRCSLENPETPDLLTVDTTSFRLLRDQKGYSLRYAKDKLLRVPQAWLVPPDELEEEAEAYVSSFNYNEQVTAFPIGDGRIGLHLSSYEIQREGSAQAAAGRDVFLVLDRKVKVLHQGARSLGFTKERVRIMGCFFAKFHSFIIGDINNDRLIDIGVTKEEVKREEMYDEEKGVDRMVGPFYAQHPVSWYLFVGNHWKYNPGYDGKLPPTGHLKLPLIGLVKSPVDFVKEIYRERLKKPQDLFWSEPLKLDILC